MLNAFECSVAIFVRGLTNLKGMLTKAEAHASSRGIDPASLLDAKLADDMYTLAVQAHWACEGAKLAVHRLLGVDAPPLVDEAKTFGELYERIDAAITQLRKTDSAALEAGLDRTITIPHRGSALEFSGNRFVTEFAIPNFFFHLTTAYAILRHRGVALQKGDFMG